MAEGTNSEPAMGPAEKRIRDEVKKRSRQIDIEETWVLSSETGTRIPRFQATIENAYLEESETFVACSSVERLEERCRWWFDHMDEREVDRRASYAMQLKALIKHDDECSELFDSLVREAEEERVSWKAMAERLGTRWETQRHGDAGFGMRWYEALELLKLAWPLRGWSEGFVDQSELHILVRSGGTEIRANEPEGINVAVVGPDENEQLIVEFLPMIGVDPEAAQAAKRTALRLFGRMVSQGCGNPWGYAKHHCGTGANAYSLVRFMGRDGRKPLEHVEYGQCTPSEFVHKQLLQTDRIEPAGRLTFFERRESVAFRLERGAQTIEGYLLDLTHDSLALKLSWPIPTGCIRRTIWAPYENGYLIDTEGRLNEFGLQIAVELIDDIYEAAVAMKSRIKDIKRALGQRRGESLRDEWSFGPGPEEWRRAVWDALPCPA